MAKVFRIVTIAAVACLASACIKPPVKPGTPTTPAAPGDATAGVYQATLIPGTTTTTGGVLRVNVATGATVIAFGAPTPFVQIPDLTIPAGEYHVQVWSQPQNADGSSVAWGAMRFDRVSGRTWLLSGSGSTWNWLEISSPK
jgi:hypothetical protein